VNITYDALMKRVSRASVEDIITEIRSTSTSTESVVSSLSSPREQADDSLTSENTAETTSHNDQSLGTPELKSGVGGWTKRSTKAKKKKDKEIESKCTDNAITFEYSRQLLGRTEIQGYFGGQTLEIHVEFLGETSE
jgi:hypothetical protein